MLTVSKLARECGLGRSTVLYYESLGLLRPARRSQASYRLYDEGSRERLRQIRVYRDMGLTLADVRDIIDRPGGDAAGVLRRRLVELDAQIARLRQHQLAIARLLRQKGALGRSGVIDKDKWVGIMKGAGFSEDDMCRWHGEFERAAPEEHQEFLEFLKIPPDEIDRIREFSRKNRRT